MIRHIQTLFSNWEYKNKSIYLEFNILMAIQKIQNLRCTRINIEFKEIDNKILELEYYNSPVSKSICYVDVSCSISINDENFIEKYTNIVFEALKVVFLHKSWNLSELQKAKEYLIENNYIIPVIYAKKWIKNRKISGEIQKYYYENYAAFIFIAKNRKKEIICKKTLYKTILNPLLFDRFYTYFRSEDNKFIIEDELKEIKQIIDPVNCSYEVEFYPKENTVEELKGFMKAMLYNTPENERRKLFGYPSNG